ncbi:unnamed protein product [Ostreobium quekettii]|uniref:Uncharacterized protein n=1 Tax=Ostreobium quekettii TaxID=121088 RepID=A0A8S1J8F6_9CHLO|nr:unnamed protein product [Ostreobium quekettii]
MAGNFPAEHPLWRDINFCPEWVYQRIQEEAARAGRPGRQVAEEPVILPGADQPWTDEENAVVLYAQSDVGRADGMSYAHVAHALGRWVQHRVLCRSCSQEEECMVEVVHWQCSNG